MPTPSRHPHPAPHRSPAGRRFPAGRRSPYDLQRSILLSSSASAAQRHRRHATRPGPRRRPAATSSPLTGKPHLSPGRRSAAYFCPPDPPSQTRAGEQQAAPRKMGWKAAEKLIRHWKILRGDNVISLVLHSMPPVPLVSPYFLLIARFPISPCFSLPGDDHQRQGQGGDRAHQAGHSVAESRHRRGQELGNLLLYVFPGYLARVWN